MQGGAPAGYQEATAITGTAVLLDSLYFLFHGISKNQSALY